MAPKRCQAATTRTLSVLILAMALGVVDVAALGINCRGSGFCGPQGGAMVRLRDAISQDNDPGRLYSSGQKIACTDNNICAFVQNFGGQVTQSKIASLMPALVDHGCKICGSVPLDFPHSNNVNNGELTVNYVSNICFRKPASDVCV